MHLTVRDCARSSRPAAIDAVKKELARRTDGRAYKLLTPPNRKPPTYRDGA